MRRSWAVGGVSIVLLLQFGTIGAQAHGASTAHRPPPWRNLTSADWVGVWGVPPENNHYQPGDDQSYREIVHPTVGGRAVRLRLSNRYGTQPVTLSDFTVALRTHEAAIAPRTLRTVTFGGQRSVTIPVGGEVISDPVGIRFGFGRDLAVSFFAPRFTGPATGHGFTAPIVTSYFTFPGRGDVTSQGSGAAYSQSDGNKYFLMGVEAYVPHADGTVVAFGDSITDGTHSGANRYDDWPDVLARRLHRAGLRLGVVNAGIGGNTLTRCPIGEAAFGDAGIRRFARDVLSWPQVRSTIILEGGNDLRQCTYAKAASVEIGLRAVMALARAAGVRILLATYPPKVCRDFGPPNSCPNSMGDNERVRLNRWIRHRRARVAQLLDWDRLLREPGHRHIQDPRWGTTDGIHPGRAGYRAMADEINLRAVIP